MQFGLACVVDGHEAHELAFQCANAELAIVAPSTLQCSLPEKAAIYAVEAGKSTSLARGPGTSQLGLKPGSAFSLNLPVKSRSGSVRCSILVNQYDRTGRRIARPAAILEGDRISGLFGLRRDADTYNLLIRLSGSGRVEFQQMSVENLPARPDLEPAIEGDGAVGELLTRHVQSLHRERKYDEAMAFADGLPEAWAHREVLRILTLYLQGDYESVIASFENGTRALQTNRAARHRYLRALANQGRVADLSRQIGRYVDTGESRPFLGAILPFAHGLDEDLCRRLTTYVMGDPLLPLNAVIACAEILLEIGETDAAHEAAKRARNIAKGRHERAEGLLLRANIAVRQQANKEAAKQFAAAFESVGRNAITLRDPAKPLSPQNLRAKRIARARGRLPGVSVVVPCYNSESSLLHALESLRAQTHEDLEILVVDDASADGSLAVAHAAAAEDGRIRVLPQDRNCGAYTARNIGLRSARGEFVLVHDADDWAHPRKVETLARYLTRNPKKIGVRARMIRFSPDIGSYHHGTYIRDDVSSFTFRREKALADAGFFDSVRAGADSEYIFRLERLRGPDCTGQIDDLLTVKLWSPKSLSGGGVFQIDEFSGAFSPVRAAYRNAYLRWHETAKDLRLEFPLAARPFEVPRQLLP